MTSEYWTVLYPQRNKFLATPLYVINLLRSKYCTKLWTLVYHTSDHNEIAFFTVIGFLPSDAMRCMVLVIVILSVRLSVCLSVTLVHCVHMVQPMIMISSPYGSHIILVSGDIKFIPKFEGDHPERGRWMRVGWVSIGDFFRLISRRISETVRDTTKVTINH